MDKDELIREGIKKLGGKTGPTCTMLGTVKSVNQEEYTCVIYDEDTDTEEPDVRLRPVLDGSESITTFPKVGSWALAIRIEDDEDWMLVAAGEIDKWEMKIGTTRIKQDATGLVIQKGSDNLKDILSSLIDEVMKIVVLQGTSPNVAALGQIKTKVLNVLK